MKTKVFFASALALVLAGLISGCNTDDLKEKTAVQKVSLSQSELTLDLGAAVRLEVVVEPENADYDSVEWISSSESVATVDDDGLVSAVGLGDAVITARAGGQMAQCNVTVIKPEVTEITLDCNEKDILIGESFDITASYKPENVPDVTIVWSSSNASVANVTQSGHVTGNGVGEAVITASVGDVSAKCTVNVLPIEAESVTLNKSELTLEVSDSERLTATVGPVNTTDKTVTWSSSDDEVATVSSDGTVTAVSPGTAVVTATCGKASGTCKVTVTEMTGTRYKLGDTYTTEDGKTGFVFWITDNGRHGKVLSTESVSTTVVWSTENELVGASSLDDGRANTEKVRSMPNYPDAYPAFKWIDDNFGQDWYMLAQEEVADFFKNLNNDPDFKSLLNSNGIYPASMDTSTERSAGEYVYLYYTSFSGTYSVYTYPKGGDAGFGVWEVRAAYEF